MKEFLVSVTIITYNQECFISRAIESVLMQKTNFDYEIIIGDDCSSDRTREIINKYYLEFPDKIKLNFQNKNVGTTLNHLTTAKLAKGVYICNLEGDDYWIDENKLQSQVDFLNSHTDFIGVSHKLVIEEPLTGYRFYEEPKHIKKDKEIKLKHALKNNFFSATSCMYKNFYFDVDKKYEELYTFHRIVGDGSFCIYLLNKGKVWAFNKAMSAYSCFQSNNYNGASKAFDIHKTQIEIWKQNEKFYDGKINFDGLILNNLLSMFYESIRRKKRKEYKQFKQKHLNTKQKILYNISLPFKFPIFIMLKIIAKIKINKIYKKIGDAK